MTARERDQLLQTLRVRFETHAHRHRGIAWADALSSLLEMENTGGEPNVIGFDEKERHFIFCDCCAESPSERRSVYRSSLWQGLRVPQRRVVVLRCTRISWDPPGLNLSVDGGDEGGHLMPIELLKSLVGTWEGTCSTWFEPGKLADESKVKGTIRSLLDGRFIRHEY